MNRYITISLAISIMFLLNACSSEESDRANDKTITEPLPMVTPDQIQRSEATQAFELEPATTRDVQGGGQRMNPAHGEPGHVCEIPVGAPLDGSGAQGDPMQSITIDPNAQNGSATFSTPPQRSSPVQMGGSGKINPPHGEPGHVCEIAVGDPLP